MPFNDLKDAVVSDTDFYALLGVTFETSQRDIDRAWRQTALKYHPDKVGDDPAAKEKFHLAQIGYDLLSDPARKALYDSARNARIQREKKNNELKGRRRMMAEDLFTRERGFKRERDEGEDEEERLEMEVRRLADDGKRRRKEREDNLRKEMQNFVRHEPDGGERLDGTVFTSQTCISEIDRTVKIRWPLGDGQLLPIGQNQITDLFSKFGKIESADLLNPKLLKSEKRKKHKKELLVTCMVQYSSIVSAHTAVEDFKKQQGHGWERIDSVFWAAGKEPHFISAATQKKHVEDSPDLAPLTPKRDNGEASTGKSVPSSFNLFNAFPTPSATTAPGADGLRKKPSFASFSSAAVTTPTGSPASYISVNSPSFEEMMMIRLKNAEKKRLEDEIRKQDEAVAPVGSGEVDVFRQQ
ncbi:hypothetical protein MMC31_002223 [Peltigera leucophlebia]|nr:hypothetical protein [Peltigera leucophlebia]